MWWPWPLDLKFSEIIHTASLSILDWQKFSMELWSKTVFFVNICSWVDLWSSSFQKCLALSQEVSLIFHNLEWKRDHLINVSWHEDGKRGLDLNSRGGYDGEVSCSFLHGSCGGTRACVYTWVIPRGFTPIRGDCGEPLNVRTPDFSLTTPVLTVTHLEAVAVSFGCTAFREIIYQWSYQWKCK